MIVGRQQIADQVYRVVSGDRPGVDRSVVNEVVENTFHAIVTSVVAGNQVKIPPLGTFGSDYRPRRKARNPRTGTVVVFPERFVPNFIPEERFREDFSREESRRERRRE